MEIPHVLFETKVYVPPAAFVPYIQFLLMFQRAELGLSAFVIQELAFIPFQQCFTLLIVCL